MAFIVSLLILECVGLMSRDIQILTHLLSASSVPDHVFFNLGCWKFCNWLDLVLPFLIYLG